MASIPKWMGDQAEKLYSHLLHPVEVASVEYLTPVLKRITMLGDFSGVKYAPGNVILFRISDTEYRHYTIESFDAENSLCAMLIYLHGKGLGSDWAKSLSVGQKIKFTGPGGKIGFDYSSQRHFAFGDETAIGTLKCIREEAKKLKHDFFGLAELDNDKMDWPELIDLSVDKVPKSFERPAEPAFSFLERIDPEAFIDATFYLTGRAKSIQVVRWILKQKGVPMKSIHTEPYWAEGKSGL